MISYNNVYLARKPSPKSIPFWFFAGLRLNGTLVAKDCLSTTSEEFKSLGTNLQWKLILISWWNSRGDSNWKWKYWNNESGAKLSCFMFEHITDYLNRSTKSLSRCLSPDFFSCTLKKSRKCTEETQPRRLKSLSKCWRLKN